MEFPKKLYLMIYYQENKGNWKERQARNNKYEIPFNSI